MHLTIGHHAIFTVIKKIPKSESKSVTFTPKLQ